MVITAKHVKETDDQHEHIGVGNNAVITDFEPFVRSEYGFPDSCNLITGRMWE